MVALFIVCVFPAFQSSSITATTRRRWQRGPSRRFFESALKFHRSGVCGSFPPVLAPGLHVGQKKMKTHRVIIALVISLIAIQVLIAFLGHFLGLHYFSLIHLIYPAFWLVLIVVHIVAACAIFRDVRRRTREGMATFLSLDSVFWAMIGLVFGVVGLLAHWFFNDYLRTHGYLAQQIDDGNSVKPPGDERTP